MNQIVVVVAATAAISTIFFALRANMLKPEQQLFPTAHISQRLCVFLMAGVSFVHGCGVINQGYATWTEAFLTSAVGVYAVVRWLSLRSQARPAATLLGGFHDLNRSSTAPGLRSHL